MAHLPEAPLISAALMSSASAEWFTPPEVLTLVRLISPDHRIGLDPCTSADNPCAAAYHYTERDDGLSCSWEGLGLVYVNPPYGRPLADWAKKIHAEGTRGVEIVACLPARTDTRWFRLAVAAADVACFWHGRLRFSGSSDAAPFPSVFAYWGDSAKRFRRVFSSHGWVPN